MTLIVCPLKTELKLTVEALSSLGWKIRPKQLSVGRVYECKAHDVLLMAGGIGEEKLSQKVTRLLESETPFKRVICVGTAGALDARLTTGDVVVAFYSGPIPGEFSFSVFKGEMARSQLAIESEEAKDALRKSTQALAVALEGGELLKMSTGERGFEYFELRAISDFADNQTASDFYLYQRQAMKNASVVLHELFTLKS